MSRFGCAVCGEPVEPGRETCSEDCELVQDAALCPECSHAVEPFSWHTGAPLRREAHAASCSRIGDDLVQSAPR